MKKFAIAMTAMFALSGPVQAVETYKGVCYGMLDSVPQLFSIWSTNTVTPTQVTRTLVSGLEAKGVDVATIEVVKGFVQVTYSAYHEGWTVPFTTSKLREICDNI